MNSFRFKNKTILIISPETWDHISVSKHHYARHLSLLGASVFFLNPPSKSWSLEQTETSSLLVLNYTGFTRGIKYYPSFISRQLFKNKLNEIEEYCKNKIDIIWSFDNSVFFDFTLLDTFNISHIVDLNQNFETEKASASADINLFVTQEIGAMLKQYNSNSYFINHGYSPSEILKNIEMKRPYDKIMLYAGNLDMKYLDWEVMHQAALINPDVGFILLGPIQNNRVNDNTTLAFREKMLSLKNVITLGKVPSHHLESYYALSDVLLVAYQEPHHHEQSNSHKIMEYLASGKPIVATYTAEYEGLGLLNMSVKNSEWVNTLKTTIDYLEEEKKKASARITYALDNTYAKQIDRIEKIIGSVPKSI